MGGRGLRERGEDGEGEEGKPTQASNSKTAYDCSISDPFLTATICHVAYRVRQAKR